MRQYNLIVEYVVWVHLIVPGYGERLFRESSSMEKLKLCGAQTTPSGIAILRYEPER